MLRTTLVQTYRHADIDGDIRGQVARYIWDDHRLLQIDG